MSAPVVDKEGACNTNDSGRSGSRGSSGGGFPSGWVVGPGSVVGGELARRGGKLPLYAAASQHTSTGASSGTLPRWEGG